MFKFQWNILILILIAIANSGCKFELNMASSLKAAGGSASIDALVTINSLNKNNYSIEGSCSVENTNIIISVAQLKFAALCVEKKWELPSIDVSAASEGNIDVTARDVNSAFAFGENSTLSVLKDTVAPAIILSVANNAVSEYGQNKDIVVTFSEPVTRSDDSLNNSGERLFLVSSIDGTSIDIGSLDTSTQKTFSGFYLSSAANTVTLVNNYSSSEDQGLFFKDAAGNVITANSNTLSFQQSCGPDTQYAALGGGLGTTTSPYEIRTIDHFNEIRNADHCKYKLMNNIDGAATTTWNSGEGFQGMSLSAGGELDGQNFSVSSLFVNTSGGFGGIFGYLAGKLENITFNNLDMTSAGCPTNIVGYADSSGLMRNITVSNSTFVSTSNGGDSYCGLFGYSNAPITNVTINNVTVRADQGANNINGVMCCSMAPFNGLTISNFHVIGHPGSRVEFFAYYLTSTLSNVNISNSSVFGNSVTGLVPPIDGAISNLTISNFTVTGDAYAVGLASDLNANVTNVNITNMTVVSNSGQAIGLIGRVSGTGSMNGITASGMNVTSTNNNSYAHFETLEGPVTNFVSRNFASTGAVSVFGLASSIDNNGSSTLGAVETLLLEGILDGSVNANSRGLADTMSGSASVKTALVKLSTVNTNSSNSNCGVGTLSDSSSLRDVALECSGAFSAVVAGTTADTSSIRRLYVRGPKGGTGSVTGNFITSTAGTAVVSDVFYNSEFGINTYGSAARTTAQLKTLSTYSAWDFTKWNITSNFPFLIAFPNE